MRRLKNLFDRNRSWADSIRSEDPGFFAELSRQQHPKYLWIGCADSRVPATSITDLKPGELFVHRNVANVVVHTDLNCLSVIQFAVEVLKVEHIIVCGHYDCGGVKAALGGKRHGLIDNWLRHIQDVAQKHGGILDGAGSVDERADRLSELNVIEQVLNVCRTTIVEDAWDRGQALCVHSWIYSLEDGILHDLGICVEGADEVEQAHLSAVGSVAGKLAESGNG